MSRARIILRLVSRDDPLTVEIGATNGDFSGKLNCYCVTDDLVMIGNGLIAFPSKTGDKFRHEMGSPQHLHFCITAITTNLRGSCALQLAMSDNRINPLSPSCQFTIETEAAAINRLGNLFLNFSNLHLQSFTWTETDETLD